MRPDGSDARQITELPGISEYPSWSPDSTRIAFHCTMGRVLGNGTGDFEICVVNADGTDVQQLTDTRGENKLPAWSPDGSLIAFQSNRHGWPSLPAYTPPGYDRQRFGEFDIFVMNIDGSGQTNLTNNPREDETDAAWAPDGRLLFTRYGCLIMMHADGSNLTPISEAGCTGLDSGHFPSWWQPVR